MPLFSAQNDNRHPGQLRFQVLEDLHYLRFALASTHQNGKKGVGILYRLTPIGAIADIHHPIIQKLQNGLKFLTLQLIRFND